MNHHTLILSFRLWRVVASAAAYAS